MLLVSQVAGALAGGVVVLALAWTCGLRGRLAVAAVAVVSISVAALLSLPNLRLAVATFLDERRTNVALTSELEESAPGIAAGVEVAFVDWADERLAPGETFRLVLGKSVEEGLGGLTAQWILFQLSPHLGRPPGAAADRIVFYDVAPDRYSGTGYDDVEIYKQGYAIARSIDGR